MCQQQARLAILAQICKLCWLSLMSSLPSSSWDGAVAARAALIDNGVAEDLRDVEDHFWRIGSLMLKLIDKYGDTDAEALDRIRRAHEDLELKLVKASIQKASAEGPTKDEHYPKFILPTDETIHQLALVRSMAHVMASENVSPPGISEEGWSDVELSCDLDVPDVADVPVEEETHEAPPVLPANSDVHGVPDAVDVVDLVSESSNNTELYPEDDDIP